MEAILLIGLQGAGKSSFYQERFFRSHVHISLDVLKTRHREQRFLNTCFETQQRFVIDNTNPSRAERSRYIAAARAAGYAIRGYYFQSRIEDCRRRNANRTGHECVPDVAIFSTAKVLEFPSREEGFDSVFYVRIVAGQFVVEEWRDEV